MLPLRDSGHNTAKTAAAVIRAKASHRVMAGYLSCQALVGWLSFCSALLASSAAYVSIAA
jgi:hypothetical protein